MAQVTIILQDTPEGPGLSVFADPKMPQTMLDGAPTPAQSAAAFMLNQLQSMQEQQPSRIIQLN